MPSPQQDTAQEPGQDRSTETTLAGLPWVQYERCRQPFRDRWPSVFRLPLVRDHYELAVEAELPIRSLLDVGATDRMHEGKARSSWPGLDYRSLDVDRTNRHDYHDFAEVQTQFDLVTLLEVLEHVPHKVALELMSHCFRACRSGGYLLASVPNVYASGIQHEWTHVTALQYACLAGLLKWSGFEVVAAARVYAAPSWHWFLHTKVLHALHRLIGVYYAQSIVMLARKP
jgi:SAM-dependent methyltransferase